MRNAPNRSGNGIFNAVDLVRAGIAHDLISRFNGAYQTGNCDWIGAQRATRGANGDHSVHFPGTVPLQLEGLARRAKSQLFELRQPLNAERIVNLGDLNLIDGVGDAGALKTLFP